MIITKKIFLSSAIMMSILCPSSVISNPFTNPNLIDINKNSNKSFITKAVDTKEDLDSVAAIMKKDKLYEKYS